MTGQGAVSAATGRLSLGPHPRPAASRQQQLWGNLAEPLSKHAAAREVDALRQQVSRWDVQLRKEREMRDWLAAEGWRGVGGVGGVGPGTQAWREAGSGSYSAAVFANTPPRAKGSKALGNNMPTLAGGAVEGAARGPAQGGSHSVEGRSVEAGSWRVDATPEAWPKSHPVAVWQLYNGKWYRLYDDGCWQPVVGGPMAAVEAGEVDEGALGQGAQGGRMGEAEAWGGGVESKASGRGVVKREGEMSGERSTQSHSQTQHRSRHRSRHQSQQRQEQSSAQSFSSPSSDSQRHRQHEQQPQQQVQQEQQADSRRRRTKSKVQGSRGAMLDAAEVQAATVTATATAAAVAAASAPVAAGVAIQVWQQMQQQLASATAQQQVLLPSAGLQQPYAQPLQQQQYAQQQAWSPPGSYPTAGFQSPRGYAQYGVSIPPTPSMAATSPPTATVGTGSVLTSFAHAASAAGGAWQLGSQAATAGPYSPPQQLQQPQQLQRDTWQDLGAGQSAFLPSQKQPPLQHQGHHQGTMPLAAAGGLGGGGTSYFSGPQGEVYCYTGGSWYLVSPGADANAGAGGVMALSAAPGLPPGVVRYGKSGADGHAVQPAIAAVVEEDVARV